MNQNTYIYALTPRHHETTGYALFKQELNGPQQSILAEECDKARSEIQKQMKPYSVNDILSRALMRFRYRTGIPGYIADSPIAGTILF